MATKIQPLEDRVLVKQLENEEEKIGNIYIPDTAKEKPQIGVVIAVGTDEGLIKILKKDDKVYYAKYSGTEIKSDGENLIILKKEDILAKIVN